MISLILLFPLLACFILFLIKNRMLNNLMIILYAVIHLICSVCLCVEYNPFDISQNLFAVTGLNKIFLPVLSIVYLAAAIYNSDFMKNDTSLTRKLRHYTYAVLLFVLSMTGSILSTNLGMTWVFIEATTLASAYLIYFYKTKHSIEAAWKYVFICSIGIALAFVGIILLTIATGNLNSLNYDELYANAQNFDPFWLKLSFVFILFGIGTKMGLAPVHFWLPDAYAQAPTPIFAILSTTLLNSVFLMILNVLKIMTLAECDGYSRIMLVVMGFLSVFIAAVFVYHINNYKRMLAYSSIENMGILAIGTALGGIGLYAAIIHMIGHSFVKAAFFMTAGNIQKIYGTKKINSVTGIFTRDNKTGWLWVLSCLGITAFPPSVLFLSEFLIVKKMLQNSQYLMSAFFLILLTIVLYGLCKAVFRMVVNNENARQNGSTAGFSWNMYLPPILLLILLFVMGIYLPFADVILYAVYDF